MRVKKITTGSALAGLTLLLLGICPLVLAEQDIDNYSIKPGDTLFVSIWKEDGLTMETLVLPDGKFSFPLVGDVQAAGRSAAAIRDDLVARIDAYIPDAVATVMVQRIEGNKAFVVGRVNRPGPIFMTSDTNVMQALSLAGGTAQFAGLKDIIILRGADGNQTAIPFNYDEVEDGENLGQNITLQAGDVVVVP